MCKLVEGFAILRKILLRYGSVGNMDVFLGNVNMVEERLVQPVVAALGLILGRRIILVYREHLYVLERHQSLVETAGQFIVERNRGDSG